MLKFISIKLILLGCLGFAFAQQESTSSAGQDTSNPPVSVKPDNSKANQGDRSEGRITTADQQKENASDRQLTQEIRKALVKDKSLSTYAHNVKVVSQDGMITLKGPVRSEQEKEAVEAKATEIAGADKVRSEISVASDKKSSSDGKSPQ